MNEKRSGLQVYTLGGFKLYYNGQPVRLKKKQNAKPVQLLQLLLNDRAAGLSRSAAVEALYGERSKVDTVNNLNATVSQLRRLLRESSLPDRNYIRSEADRYFFECPFPVWVDVEEAAQLRLTAEATPGPNRLNILYRMCDLYQGRFLPELDGVSWVETARGQYHRIYRESLEEICRYLVGRQSYSEVLRLTQQAAKLFPFDEWQVWQQDCLLAQGHLGEAQELYRQVEKLYLDEMNAPPPDRMRLRLQQFGTTPSRKTDALLPARERLDQERVNGPYGMSLPNFLNAYNLISRMSGAVKQPLCLMLCTLNILGERTRQERIVFQETMNRFEGALSATLRGEDVFTRYSRSQYLVLLVGATPEDGNAVRQRVSSHFLSQGGGDEVRLDFQTMRDGGDL